MICPFIVWMRKLGGNLDGKHNISCCSFSLSCCRYKETCMHKGLPSDITIADKKSKCSDDHICLALSESDGFGDMDGFLMVKKMSILKECSYWRFRA